MRLKNFTLSILFLFSFSFAHSQCEDINGSFEDWILTDFILPGENGEEVTGEVFVPKGTTSLIRLLFLGFSASFDPSFALLLENEAQELLGISQSTDASQGEFAVKLQGGYGIETADIFGVFSCTEVPEQFNLDVKHFGETDDSLSVVVVFDEGLEGFPQTEADFADIPAYGSVQLKFDSNTEYETVSIPIIQNFEAAIDTFYYVIFSETYDTSYFIIDNVNFGDGDSDCQIVAPTLTTTTEEPICICNGISTSFSLNYNSDPEIEYKELILDEFGIIVSIDNTFVPGIHIEFCYPADDYTAVVIAYKGVVTGLNEGNHIDELVGCYELSNELEIETYRIPDFEFSVFVDGEQQEEDINICVQDDLEEVLSFSVDTEFDNIAILLINEDDELAALRIDDVDETTTVMGLAPGDYVLGAIRYDGSFNLAVGQDADDLTWEGCFSISEDVYEVNLLGSEDEYCITDVEEIYSGKISIIPNYSNGLFEINNPNNESYQYVVRDISGKMVISSDDIKNDNLIDLSKFPNGLYVVSFNIDGYIHQEKIIKF